MSMSNYMWYCFSCKELYLTFTKHYKNGKICVKCQSRDIQKVQVSKRMKMKCKRNGLDSIPFNFKKEATNVEMRASILTALTQRTLEK